MYRPKTQDNLSSAQNYERNVIAKTEYFEIVSCIWREGSVSSMHEHGWSECYVLVEEGEFENILQLGNDKQAKLFKSGETFCTPIGTAHEIRCRSLFGKTLHVYTPPVQKERTQNFSSILPAEIRKKIDLELGEKKSWDKLEQCVKDIKNNSISTYSPFFMNQLFSGVHPESHLAEKIIAETRTTLATYEASPIFSLIEEEVIKALGEKIGWPRKSNEGISVPGGSAANFMAVHCARSRMIPNYRLEGLGSKKVAIYVSEAAHYSFEKACLAMGFGLNALVKIKTTSDGRMDISDLEQKMIVNAESGVLNLFVCATAGTTVFGAFDPIEDISILCKKFGSWLHVDAAWGGPVLFSDHRALMNKVELADSLTFDAHKLLGAGLTSSFFVTQHPKILAEANNVSGTEYLFHEDESFLDRGKLSWQCGRRAEALPFWMLWKSKGDEGFAQLVNEKMELSNWFVNRISQENRIQLLQKPSFLNICFKIIPKEKFSGDFTLHVREKLKEKNQAMINYSLDTNREAFLRLVLCHPNLEKNHLEDLIHWMLNI